MKILVIIKRHGIFLLYFIVDDSIIFYVSFYFISILYTMLCSLIATELQQIIRNKYCSSAKIQLVLLATLSTGDQCQI